MIHVLLTQDTSIREILISEYGLNRIQNLETYKSGEIILVYRETLDPSIISHVIEEYAAEKIWIIGSSRVVSNEHELGDIIMPNVFLPYDHEIDAVEFDRENQDAFLHDPLFLHHYEEQSDLDFESFGLSIGGICVTKWDGMDSVEREQVEFAYSADCIDEISYPLVLAAEKIDRKEDIYPVLLIVGRDSDTEEMIRLIKNIHPVLVYLQTKMSGIAIEEDEEGEEDDDEEE